LGEGDQGEFFAKGMKDISHLFFSSCSQLEEEELVKIDQFDLFSSKKSLTKQYLAFL
jgi:hypothetical protein